MLSHHLQDVCRVSLPPAASAAATHCRIIKTGVSHNAASLVSAYVHSGCLPLAHQLLLESLPFCSFNLLTGNLIIARYGHFHFNFVRSVFDKMPVRDVVSWNSMIGACVKNERFPDAIQFFKKMLSGPSIQPDEFTFASLLSGCARLGSFTRAKWLHDLMISKGIELNSILSAALVDVYSKCGRIEEARRIFEITNQRSDVSVWNAMINGLAIHGLAFDAIKLFSQMEVENVAPDSITFLGVLKACSHSGLVTQGQDYFDRMKHHHWIQPQLEHYGAMVDLLGRAGLLDEAYAVIKSMPMEPDVVLWRTLLSACRTYKRPDLGEIAIRNISSLDSADYVLLSNTYCSVKKWDEAERFRDSMRRNRVRKNLGKSWLELAGAIHHFKAGDRSHPETKEIYRVLEGLLTRAKQEGFEPVQELVMMDVSEEEKEGSLTSHSEKLAVAYGILKTSPGVELLIYKNLRTCHDCHHWMKFISRILNRVVTVRDRIRFHRFAGGVCSCKDYW